MKYHRTEEVETFYPLAECLRRSFVHGPVIAEHHVQNDGKGLTTAWSEVVLVDDNSGGRQICHCTNAEDAELIAALINEVLNAA